MQTSKHYVYEWVRPDYDVVFWVGKGVRRRAWNFKRNAHTNRVIAALSDKNMVPQVRVIAHFSSKQAAFEFEIERIAFWEPLGELTNKTKGGEGRSGFAHTKEFKGLMREYAKDPNHPIHSQESVGKRTASLCKFYSSEKGQIAVLERTPKVTQSRIEYFATDKGKEQARRHGDNLIELFKTERGKGIAKQIGQSRKAFNETDAGRLCAIETGKKISLTNRGEGNGRAKINNKQAIAIYLDPRSDKQIAESYGISTGIVRSIKRKTSWKHIHKEPENG